MTEIGRQARRGFRVTCFIRELDNLFICGERHAYRDMQYSQKCSATVRNPNTVSALV